jgi:fructose-specific phosphotransferase system IIC component
VQYEAKSVGKGEKGMSDTTRGLTIGIVVGLLGGLMIGAIIGGLVREFAPLGPITSLVVDNAQLWGIIIGVVVGGISSYRMLQALERKREE